MSKTKVTTATAVTDVRKWAWAIGLFAFLLFGNTLFNGYNLDDELVTRSHRLTSKGLSSVPAIITSPYYEDELGYRYEYRPVTLMSFAIEHAVFGERPWSSHLVNVLLYAVTCVLVFRMLCELFPLSGMTMPIVASLLFVVHPLHTEVVASIKCRDEILSLLGGVTSALMMLRYLHTSRFIWLPLMMFFLFFGLMSKLSVASFVVILPLMAVFRNANLRQLAGVMTGCMAVVVITLMLRPVTYTSWASFPLLIALPLGFRAAYESRKTWHWIQQGWAMASSRILRWSGLILDTRLPYLSDNSSSLRSSVLFIVPLTLLVAVGLVIKSTVILSVGVSLLLFHPLFLGGTRMVVVFCAMFSVIALSFTLTTDAYHLLFLTFSIFLVILRVFGQGLDGRTLGLFHGLMLVSIGALSLYYGDSLQGQWSMGLYLSIVLLPGYFASLPMVAGRLLSTGLLLVLITIVTYGFFGRFNFVLLFPTTLMFALSLSVKVPGVRPAVLFAVLMLPGLSSHIVHTLSAPPQSFFEQSSSQINGVSDGTEKEPKRLTSTTASVDRPLTHLEYPLGFDATLGERVATASTVLGHYMRLTVFPYPLAFYYGYRHFDRVPISDWRAIISLTMFLLLILFATYLLFKQSPSGLGLWTFILSILLFSNLFEPVAGMAADRLAYVASLGYCMAVGHLFAQSVAGIRNKNARYTAMSALAGLLLIFSGVTVARNFQWKNELTLMRADIKHVSNSAQAHNMLASHLMKYSFEGKYVKDAVLMQQEALQHLKESARIYPGYLNVWYDMGRVYMILNEPSKALLCFEQVHNIDPYFYAATLQVAELAETLGDYPKAITFYERCIKHNPLVEAPYNDLSYLHFRKGNFMESIAVNERAIQQNPNWSNPYKNLAKTYIHIGRHDKAEEVMNRYNTLHP